MAAAARGSREAAAGGAASFRRRMQRADGQARRAYAPGPPQHVHAGAQVLHRMSAKLLASAEHLSTHVTCSPLQRRGRAEACDLWTVDMAYTYCIDCVQPAALNATRRLSPWLGP